MTQTEALAKLRLMLAGQGLPSHEAALINEAHRAGEPVADLLVCVAIFWAGFGEFEGTA